MLVEVHLLAFVFVPPALSSVTRHLSLRQPNSAGSLENLGRKLYEQLNCELPLVQLALLVLERGLDKPCALTACTRDRSLAVNRIVTLCFCTCL